MPVYWQIVYENASYYSLAKMHATAFCDASRVIIPPHYKTSYNAFWSVLECYTVYNIKCTNINRKV